MPDVEAPLAAPGMVPPQSNSSTCSTARKPGAPINVFIHGGAWRVGDAAYHAYQSEMFVDAGAHFIALDFNNVLDTNGNLMPIAEQVRRAVAWVYRNAARFGGNFEPALRVRAFIRGPSRSCGPYDRLAERLRLAEGHSQRWPVCKRHGASAWSE